MAVARDLGDRPPPATVIVFLIRATGLLQGSELAALDVFFRLRPWDGPDKRVLVVGISESDLQQYGHPINDQLLAQALAYIAAGQPRAIGLDIYRDLPVPPSYREIVQQFQDQPELLLQNPPLEPGHAQLNQLYREIDNLIGIAKITGGVDRVAPPPVLAELGRVGANDLPRDQDGRLRRAFLYLTDPQSQEIVLSIGLHLALLHLEPYGIFPEVTDDDRQWVQLGDTVFVPLYSGDGGYGAFDDRGYQIFINYRKNGKAFETISLQDILEQRVSSDIFRDRTVLIGHTAESLKDFFDTPFSVQAEGIQKTSGVEVHANVVSHILSATLDGRSQILTLPNPLEWAWIFLAAISGASLAWIWRYSDRAMRLLGQILSGTVIIGIAYWAFLEGWWIPLLPPLLAQSLAALSVIAYVARSAVDIRQTFSRYLTDEVVATLLETPKRLAIRRRTASNHHSHLRLTRLHQHLRTTPPRRCRLHPQHLSRSHGRCHHPLSGNHRRVYGGWNSGAVWRPHPTPRRCRTRRRLCHRHAASHGPSQSKHDPVRPAQPGNGNWHQYRGSRRRQHRLPQTHQIWHCRLPSQSNLSHRILYRRRSDSHYRIDPKRGRQCPGN